MIVTIQEITQAVNTESLLSDLRALFDTYAFTFENRGVVILSMPLYMVQTTGGLLTTSQPNKQSLRVTIDCEPQGPNTILRPLPEPRQNTRWPFWVDKPLTLSLNFTLENGITFWHIHKFEPGIEYLEHFNGGDEAFLERLATQ